MADKNYGIMSIGTVGGDLAQAGRIMAGEQLGLTGCEISFNATPAGGFVPFVHAHKLNEEVYIRSSPSRMATWCASTRRASAPSRPATTA